MSVDWPLGKPSGSSEPAFRWQNPELFDGLSQLNSKHKTGRRLLVSTCGHLSSGLSKPRKC